MCERLKDAGPTVRTYSAAMPVTLQDVLDNPNLRLRLRTGKTQTRRAIRWVAVTEVGDPSPFLESGELVLTTGLTLTEENVQRGFVEHAASRGAAGLGFKLDVRHRAVPETILRTAQDFGLPVLEVPFETPFVAISKFVGERIAQEHSAQLRELLTDHDRLAGALLSGRGLQAMTDLLRTITGGSVAVIDYHGSLLASTPRTTHWPVDRILRGDLPPDGELAARPIEVADAVVAFLVDRASEHTQVLPYAVNLIGLELARRQAVLSGQRELVGQLIEDTIKSRVAAGDAQQRLAGFGIDVRRGHTMLVATVNGGTGGMRRSPWSIYPLSEDGQEPVITAVIDDQLVAIAADTQAPRTVANQLLEFMAKLGPGARVGIGGSYPGVPGLRWSFFEARSALDKGPGIHEGDPLNLPRLLLSNPDLPLRQLSAELLKPLLEFDKANDAALVNTLRIWLTADCSVADTAETLFVHRNTVRYRLSQIAELTNRSLTSIEDKVQLWLALVALRLTED
ncbi:PucR family transcriptional regulator [Pseudonocardiaceae bacterium YIM PH 21723]|nr:PucR family transcriptional regulator [Pseudonocardiaceae bacterium YIM PH 21723]